MELVLGGAPAAIPQGAAVRSSGAPPTSPEARTLSRAVLPALGGAANVRTAEPCARTRVRLLLADPALLDEPALVAAGIGGVMRLPGGIVHLVLGEEAEALAAALRDTLRGAGD